jgi:hypothetical protein
MVLEECLVMITIYFLVVFNYNCVELPILHEVNDVLGW